MGRVFRYAVGHGLCNRDPSRDTELCDKLAPVSVRHHVSITDPKEVGPLLRPIEDYTGSFVVPRMGHGPRAALPRFSRALPRLGGSYIWILTQGEQFFLAGEAVFPLPQLAARWRDFKEQAAAVKELVMAIHVFVDTLVVLVLTRLKPGLCLADIKVREHVRPRGVDSWGNASWNLSIPISCP